MFGHKAQSPLPLTLAAALMLVAPIGATASGSDRTHGSVTVEAGGLDESGGQLSVREYDRRIYPGPDVRELELFSQIGSGQLFLGIWNPLSPVWAEGSLQFIGEKARISYDMVGLTHHMPSFRQSFILDGVRRVITPITASNIFPGAVYPEGTWDPNYNRLDLSFGNPFYLDRIEHDFDFAYGDLEKVRARAGIWIEDEKGMVEQWRTGRFEGIVNQFGANFSTLEHPQTSFAHPYDRTATELEAGVDAQIKDTSVYATFFDQKLEESTPAFDFRFRTDTDGGATFRRNSVARFSDREGNGVRVGFNTPIGDKAHINAYLVDRDRRNTFNGYKIDLNTFATNVTWAPSREFYLFSRYMHFNRSTERNAGFIPTDSLAPATVDPAMGIFNESRNEFEIGTRFSGIRNHSIQAGFRSRDSQRPNDIRSALLVNNYYGDDVRGLGERVLEVHREKAETGYWVKFRGKPGKKSKLNYSASWQAVDGNRASYTRGSTHDSRELRGDVGYDFGRKLSTFLSYDHKTTDSDFEPVGERLTHYAVGLHGRAGRWGLGAYYNHENWDMDWLINWREGFGAAVFGSFRGFPDNAELFESQTDTYTLDITPPRAGKLDTQFSLSLIDADSYQPMAAYDHHFAQTAGGLNTMASDLMAAPGIGRAQAIFDDVNAVDTVITRIRTRAQYDLGKDRSLGLDWVYARWNDRIDPLQAGKFNVAFVTYKQALW